MGSHTLPVHRALRWGRAGCDALGPTERESNSLTAELDFHAKANDRSDLTVGGREAHSAERETERVSQRERLG